MSLGLRTALRSWGHRIVRRAWQRRGLLACLLYPLHLLHRIVRGFRALAWRLGFAKPVKLPVPVVVIGNLRVGGTGKTPLVIEIVRALRARGWAPGVISRGYGGRSQQPTLVNPGSDAAQCGDEPLLIRQLTGCPVAVGHDRVAAARLLLSLHASCNVLIADDGLQHRRLARDLEIVLLDEAGIGNGWLLPAGPLRDPPERLRRVDAVVLHGLVPPVRIYSPFYRMQTSLEEATCIASPARRMSLSEMAREQSAGKLRVLALCAIGNPERFFAQLRELGLRFDALALPDHDRIAARMIPPGRYERVLMTEKDAVKCQGDSRLGRDERIWVVALRTTLDASLLEFITARLGRDTDGSKAA